jgi:hypothetical protein
VQHLALAAADPGGDQPLTEGGRAPLALLELDDDGAVGALAATPAHQAVEAAGGERELVLEDDAVIEQVGGLQDLGDGAQGVAPGVDLAGGRLVAEVVEEGGFELAGDLVAGGVGDEGLG